MSTFEQHHSGSGDNVRDKIFVTIKTLAPDVLLRPMEMVFDSLRKKDLEKAKTQMSLLKSMTHQDLETDALLEAISIYGDLIEPAEQGTAWGTIFKIVSATENPIVKDVCLAAMIRLSAETEKEADTKKHFASESQPGQYAKEAFLSLLADEAELEEFSRKFVLTEGEMTGIVEGALRLELLDIAVRAGDRLLEMHPSYNAEVLRVLVSALALNRELQQRHLWLCSPRVKQKLDALTAEVVDLLGRSNGTDLRLYNMACPILNCYQGAHPPALLDTLHKYAEFLGPSHAETAAQLKALAGDDSELPQWRRDLHAASKSPATRNAWCRDFLAENTHTINQVIPFIHLATPAEITKWLAGEMRISDLSEKEAAFTQLFARSFRAAEQQDDLAQRSALAQAVEHFSDKWGHELNEISPERIFELAEKLFAAKLPDKALILTSPIIGDQALWPSNFVITHLKCLLEAQQFKTFDEVLGRVADADSSLSLMNFCSLKHEKLGEIPLALEISDQMIDLAPDLPHCWYRGCYLRDRYQDIEEQRNFQERISDSLLEHYSREAVAILFFMTRSGNFKRAETKWVDWFTQDPLSRAIEFVNFHFGSSTFGRADMEVSQTLPQCLGAVQFTQDGVRQTKLIVEDHLDLSECTLKGSSNLGQLLLSSAVDEKLTLGMVTYVIEERLPPYVACLRMAAQLRHTHNDGSDCFVIMRPPSDPEELVPFLEEKLSLGNERRSQLRTLDNIPLFMRGHGMFAENAFKAAFNCWSDAGISKSWLHANGDAAPTTVILDAYSISYLALTDLAKRLLESGITFILPAATKEALGAWVEEISDENFMVMGVTDTGKLYRTTASDLQAHSGHVIAALRCILENSTVVHPGLHNAALEVYSIRGGVDHTVYDAMQLSSASNVPWLCMDPVFASLHESSEHLVVNANALIARAMSCTPFDFEHKRHALMLYAMGALPLPLTYSELEQLAEHSNNLAGFILFKIIQNHGKQIFVKNEYPAFLLDLILAHLHGQFFSSSSINSPSYTPVTSYSSHVFNHGLQLFLSSYDKGPAEYRFATALAYICEQIINKQNFMQYVIGYFINFAQGHFFDMEMIKENLCIVMSTPPEAPESGQT
ncbi:GapS6b family protein [Pseudomonas fitomaticsae]